MDKILSIRLPLLQHLFTPTCPGEVTPWRDEDGYSETLVNFWRCSNRLFEVIVPNCLGSVNIKGRLTVSLPRFKSFKYQAP